jgi:hypothetical protein
MISLGSLKMSLKESLTRGLDTLYDNAVEKLDALFGTAEVLVETYLPDEDGLSTQAKADVLADYYVSRGGDPDEVDNYRQGNVPAPIVAALYAGLIRLKPELAVEREEVKSSQMGPADYLRYLKKNHPTMAKVYEQALLAQERINNAGHKAETDED